LEEHDSSLGRKEISFYIICYWRHANKNHIMCAHACICLYLHTYSVHTRILTLIPHILKPIHTTQFSYRNNKTFVGSSAQDVARKS